MPFPTTKQSPHPTARQAEAATVEDTEVLAPDAEASAQQPLCRGASILPSGWTGSRPTVSDPIWLHPPPLPSEPQNGPDTSFSPMPAPVPRGYQTVSHMGDATRDKRTSGEGDELRFRFSNWPTGNIVPTPSTEEDQSGPWHNDIVSSVP